MSETNRRPAPRTWLDLLDTDGPFLSVPVLKKAWPTGMNAPDRSALDALRDAKPAFEKAWDAWDMAQDTADRGTAPWTSTAQARDAWVDVILRTVLGWKNFYIAPASVDVEGSLARLHRHRQPDGRADARGHRPGRLSSSPTRSNRCATR